jgi:hypothetical protein
MDYREFIDTILSETCADERIKKGILYVDNNDHLLVLKEYVERYTDLEFSEAVYSAIQSVLCLREGNLREGNFPERQAYNENGILVTFPDAESKKAAIERGSHFEHPPGGKTSSNDSNEDIDSQDEDSDTENVFSTTETPEQKQNRKQKESELFAGDTNISVDDIRFRDDEDMNSETGESFEEKERNRLYDVLQGIKYSKKQTDADDGFDNDASFTLDKLDPSVLFALSEKWVFDKSGDWYNEDGKFRGNTDKKGHVHPSRPQDKEKMELWIEDHEKRKSGIQITDKNDM